MWLQQLDTSISRVWPSFPESWVPSPAGQLSSKSHRGPGSWFLSCNVVGRLGRLSVSLGAGVLPP